MPNNHNSPESGSASQPVHSGDRLDRLLFDGDSRLANVKLFHGENPHARPEDVRDEVARAIESALSNPRHNPPKTGRMPQSLDEFVAS